MTIEKQRLISAIKEHLDKIKDFRINSLISNPSWGNANLESHEDYIKLIFNILEKIRQIDYDQVMYEDLIIINKNVESIANLFQQIWALQSKNPNFHDLRNTIISDLSIIVNNLKALASSIFSYVGNNNDYLDTIQNANNLINDAKEIQQQALNESSAYSAELKKIVKAAQQTTLKKGTHVFSEDFKNASEDAKKASIWWLVAAGIFATITLCVAIYMWQRPAEGDLNIIIQKLGTKIIILSILLSATFWCGKIYKTLRHQYSTNKHRYMSIRTITAFRESVNDPNISDALTYEAARSVFRINSTGYIDENGSSSDSGDLKILEIAKNFTPNLK